jgi:hypothetical protein
VQAGAGALADDKAVMRRGAAIACDNCEILSIFAVTESSTMRPGRGRRQASAMTRRNIKTRRAD